MTQKRSITQLLRSWPHEPGRLNARILEDDDGREVLQVRLELGILQLETRGRPDGLRPEGADSWFDHHRERSPSAPGGASLDPPTCALLREEAALYAYRGMVFSVLDDLEGVLRDAERNLDLAAHVLAHAEVEADRDWARSTLRQFLMLRARTRSTLAARSGDLPRARAALEEGLDALEAVHAAGGAVEPFDTTPEAKVLHGMREMLVPQLPASQRQELRERLNRALAVENFELAAILRNELRQLP